ncbi:LamG domain-containing protein [Paraglaciecola aquimarina]|uniref:LamG domain-containing protein n=1 Tax=Paraglaciecola aquimarina TaxID=1235557 RepID=A0ABU3SSW7_9ALTE|nr:LamG domain-containing protein [Paraglaciecola aquimarina]MDU0353114.1 LamG domain-containing protein [Paraglaciecola aquimarina]
MCNALDLSASGIDDYLILDEQVLTGQTDFTVSVWAKTTNTGTQAILSGAGTNRNDLLMWFYDKDTFRPYLKNTVNGDITVDSVADDNWQHFVWTREGDQSCIYQNKELQGCLTQPTSALSIQSLILGQEQDSIGGNFDASQAFNGLLDELVIYHQAMTQSEINALYDNQAAGLNVDGSPRVCPTPATLLVEYRFEESSWDGSANEVLDYSGNDHHARVLSNSTPATAIPALTGALGTCGYASQNDGSIQVTGLSLDSTTEGVKTSVTFWMNWDGTTSVMPIGWDLHDIWVAYGAFGFNTGAGDIYGVSSAGLANGWHHIVVEFTNGSVTDNRIFIDGVEQVLSQRRSLANLSRAYVNSEFNIGGWSASSSFNFHGLIDEVRIYQGKLTNTDVQTIMNERHECPVPHHYQIQHAGRGLTCEALPVTVKACADAECDTLYGNETTLSLSPSGWANSDTMTFTGELSTSLSIKSAGVYNIAQTSASPIAPLSCVSGGTTTCEIEFVDSAFVFFGETAADPLPDQLAEANFQQVNLRAVEKNTSTGACQAALTSTTNITLGYDCISPTEDKCLTPFSGIAIDGDGTGESTGTIAVAFNARGYAELTALNYADAGRLMLSAQSDSHPNIAKGTALVDVYPSYLKLSVADNALLYSGATDSDLYTAGNNFSYTIGAYGVDDHLLQNYQGANLSLKVVRDYPTVTNTVDGEFRYKNGSTVTSATGTTTFTRVNGLTFSGGQHTYATAYYSETGRISLDVQDSNYLGNQIDANALSLGTFIPGYYDISEESTAADASLQNVHVNSGADDFSYVGQGITFAKEPTLLIIPKNALDETTKNYIYSDWTYAPTLADLNNPAKLRFSDTSSYVGSAQVAHQNAPLTTIVTSEFAKRIALNSTKITYNKVNASGVMYGPVEPFDASLEINYLADFFTDENGLCFKQNYAASDCDGYDFTDVEGASLRFGRLTLKSNYGPETEPLQVPIVAEYFDDGKWLVNSWDNHTEIGFAEASGHLILSKKGDADLTNDIDSLSSANVLLLGKAANNSDLLFNAPNKIGELILQLNPVLTPTIWPEYLNYDWNGDKVICNLASCPDGPDLGSAADLTDYPNATISFGLFRGNDRIIQWREVFN